MATDGYDEQQRLTRPSSGSPAGLPPRATPFPTSRHRGFISPQQAKQSRYRGPKPWYRRRRWQLAAVSLVVVAAILTDRYDHYTPPQRAATFRSYYNQLVTDLSTCNDGVTLAGQDLRLIQSGGATVSPASVVALARSAEANCTPTSADIYTLESAQVPGALSGYTQLTLATYQLGQWAYPNAAEALLAVETLATSPADATATAKLDAARAAMTAIAGQAASTFNSVSSQLHTSIPPLGLASP